MLVSRLKQEESEEDQVLTNALFKERFEGWLCECEHFMCTFKKLSL
jgi:hypothetical protein